MTRDYFHYVSLLLGDFAEKKKYEITSLHGEDGEKES
jgi:hypothetical protein